MIHQIYGGPLQNETMMSYGLLRKASGIHAFVAHAPMRILKSQASLIIFQSQTKVWWFQTLTALVCPRFNRNVTDGNPTGIMSQVNALTNFSAMMVPITERDLLPSRSTVTTSSKQ